MVWFFPPPNSGEVKRHTNDFSLHIIMPFSRYYAFSRGVRRVTLFSIRILITIGYCFHRTESDANYSTFYTHTKGYHDAMKSILIQGRNYHWGRRGSWFSQKKNKNKKKNKERERERKRAKDKILISALLKVIFGM